jgi:hypothetical protein
MDAWRQSDLHFENKLRLLVAMPAGVDMGGATEVLVKFSRIPAGCIADRQVALPYQAGAKTRLDCICATTKYRGCLEPTPLRSWRMLADYDVRCGECTDVDVRRRRLDALIKPIVPHA